MAPALPRVRQSRMPLRRPSAALFQGRFFVGPSAPGGPRTQRGGAARLSVPSRPTRAPQGALAYLVRAAGSFTARGRVPGIAVRHVRRLRRRWSAAGILRIEGQHAYRRQRGRQVGQVIVQQHIWSEVRHRMRAGKIKRSTIRPSMSAAGSATGSAPFSAGTSPRMRRAVVVRARSRHSGAGQGGGAVHFDGGSMAAEQALDEVGQRRR